ncbi:MAG: transcriptional repressor NrdR [Candidatus Moraniibacteriota bacterium]|nr:MAG: transcriptional repressor NrdR [Candidatus Moranbacteria bacterium]
MICPFCQNTSVKVIDSRDVHEGRAIRRRRECEKCGRRFTTYEEVEVLKITVVKRSGEEQEYDREKIRKGLEKAFEKRPVTLEQIEKFLGDIEYGIHSRHNEIIKSRDIGKLILKKLRDIDDVAYMRFASVYKSFKSVGNFRKELDKLEEEKKIGLRKEKTV